ncbi:hypothetical protein [Bradyrhizobium sp. STM 3557]|uniref:hypothetical protein n=1 Tax=Bradyrhizobium sp. STM 3557 TaxID=578920 RepID=UPI00388F7CDE
MTYYTNIFENKKGEFYYSGILFHTQVDAETKGSKPRRSGSKHIAVAMVIPIKEIDRAACKRLEAEHQAALTTIPTVRTGSARAPA